MLGFCIGYPILADGLVLTTTASAYDSFLFKVTDWSYDSLNNWNLLLWASDGTLGFFKSLNLLSYP